MTTTQTTSMRFHRALLVSCEIPWDERDHLMENLFRQEVRYFLKHGFNNLYVFGTAGEGYAVDTGRFQQIIRVFQEETCGEGIVPQVGVIGLSTANVIERIEMAHSLGFRIFQISLPCWGPLNDVEVLRFFKDVCGAFPDSRFLHYNLMRTKRLLSGEDYRRLVDEVPNLAATKNTSPSVAHALDLMRSVPELQHFLGEATFPIGCLYGECSLLSSFGGLFPSKTKQLFQYAVCGQIEALFRFHKQYSDAVADVLAPMKRYERIDGAYDKMLTRLGGTEMPLRLLSPYESLPEEVYEECRKIIARKYRDWLG